VTPSQSKSRLLWPGNDASAWENWYWGVGFTQSRAGVVICEGAGRIWGIPRGVLGGWLVRGVLGYGNSFLIQVPLFNFHMFPFFLIGDI
jgi:hypothetical protein